MALILSIHTALDSASVYLAGEGIIPKQLFNHEQKEHAAWLHPAIDQLIKEAGVKFTDLDAVAISAGPGSYTGLRVGYAAAKGICFAAQLPLIAINTLKIVASSQKNLGYDFICAAIDARREEVFTAIYNQQLEVLLEPQPLLLPSDRFATFLQRNTVIFTGNANEKLKRHITHPNAVFVAHSPSAAAMQPLAEQYLKAKMFADLAYAEPFYLKEFYDMKTMSKK